MYGELETRTHIQSLHPDPATGYRVFVVRKESGSRATQERYTPADLLAKASDLTGQTDLYMTVNGFSPRSKAENDLVSLRGLYADIDQHGIPAEQRTNPDDLLRDIETFLQVFDLPCPNLAVATGRGLHLVWTFADPPTRPVKGSERAAFEWWNAATEAAKDQQRRLSLALEPFGADLISDLSRMVRVAGTYNSRAAGTETRLLQTLRTEPHAFSDLCTVVSHSAKRCPEKPRSEQDESLDLLPMMTDQQGDAPLPLQEGSPERENERRRNAGLVLDLETVLRMQGGGRLRPDKRNGFLFAWSLCVALSMQTRYRDLHTKHGQKRLQTYVIERAVKWTGYRPWEIRERLWSVFEWSRRGNLHSPKTETLFALLPPALRPSIDLQRSTMRYLIGEEVRQERRKVQRRAQKERARRRENKPTQTDLLLARIERAGAVATLREQGLSLRAIAKSLSVPLRTVQRDIQTLQDARGIDLPPLKTPASDTPPDLLFSGVSLCASQSVLPSFMVGFPMSLTATTVEPSFGTANDQTLSRYKPFTGAPPDAGQE